jgi:hypothetical protein
MRDKKVMRAVVRFLKNGLFSGQGVSTASMM